MQSVYLMFILSKMYSKRHFNNHIMNLTDVSALLYGFEIKNRHINYDEVILVKYLDGDFFSLTHLDCLEHIFFENCLWHREFKFLINVGKSILAK